MLYCNKCQLEFETGKFCSECGASLQEKELSQRTHSNKKLAKFEEIVGWIQNKLEIHGRSISTQKYSDGDYMESVSESKIKNFNGNIIDLVKTTKMRDSEGTDDLSSLYTIDCSNLTTAITIKEYPEKEFTESKKNRTVTIRKEALYELTLCSISNKKAIVRVSFNSIMKSKLMGNETKSDTNPTPETAIRIYINNKDIAERMAKAFHDAIELCGGQPELY